MNSSMKQHLDGLAGGKFKSDREWIAAIETLLTSYAEFVANEFESDSEPMIDIEGRSFCQWIWSIEEPISELIPLWSGVIAGSAVSETTMAVSLSIFLFDRTTRTRLMSREGGDYMYYTLVDVPDLGFQWKSHGWIQDEFKEWNDVRYSET